MVRKKKYKPLLLINECKNNLLDESYIKKEIEAINIRNKINFKDIKILQLIGTGSQSSVKKIMWNNKKFAMKIISIHEIDEFKVHALTKNILSEFKSLKDCIKHKNIITLIDININKSTINLIFEYMNIGSLDNVVNVTKVNNEVILSKITKEILNGLSYLHNTKRICHRDLKPQNILINQRGKVKISDFGLSSYQQNTCNTFQGSLGFMSPERMKGESYSYNSDIWGLGITILYLLHGNLPFNIEDDNSIWELLEKCENFNFEIIKNQSEEFQDFIKKCLTFDPAKRTTSSELLKHKWLTDHESNKLSIGRWIYNNYTKTLKSNLFK